MFARFKEFLAQPFRSDMPASQWFAFIGLLLVILVLWSLVLSHIRRNIG